LSFFFKEGDMVSTVSATDLGELTRGYRLCARSEGKSKNTIAIVTSSVLYLQRFLESEGLPTDVGRIGSGEIRAFICYLQQKRCFSDHRFSQPQQRQLSSHTINCYLRSIRAFWSWLVSEGIAGETPFSRVKIPKAPRKLVQTFSDPQLQALLDVIDTTTAEGFRDYAIILTLLDACLRVTELLTLTLDNLWLEQGVLRVMGKGGKERLIPIGKSVQRLLWRYISHFRPEPMAPTSDFLFLTTEGRPLTKNLTEKRMAMYGARAGLKGVRCSPHTLRHTGAVTFLRNRGDVFSLQRILGHSTLAMTRHYCELADVDVKRAHVTASPVDNMHLKPSAHKSSDRPAHRSRQSVSWRGPISRPLELKRSRQSRG
jgi:site-specific recombinase XerD